MTDHLNSPHTAPAVATVFGVVALVADDLGRLLALGIALGGFTMSIVRLAWDWQDRRELRADARARRAEDRADARTDRRDDRADDRAIARDNPQPGPRRGPRVSP